MSPKRRVTRPNSAQLAAAAAARAPKRDAALQYRRLRQRRRVAIVLFVLGPLVAAFHLLEHLNFVRLFNPHLEDLLIGYPTAIVLLVVGATMWG